MNARMQTAGLAPTPSAAAASSLAPLLQRKCVACGTHTPASGSCESCSGKTKGLQRKLRIGASNDPLEIEADRIADRVLSGPAAGTASSSPIRVQRYAPSAAAGMYEAPESVSRVVGGGGEPLGEAVRHDMEQRFGHDFSHVRVHHDSAAAQSARDVGARAYTVGRDIVFGAGMYAPASSSGRRLLAHELTHTVQQGGGAPVLRRTPTDDIQEKLSYKALDWVVTDAEATSALDILKTLPFADQVAILAAEKQLYLERLRSNLPAARLPELEKIVENIAKALGLEKQKAALEAVTAPGSGKSFGEVGGSLAKLKSVAHELAVRQTGTGIYVGTECPNPAAGATPTNCTNIVLEVLRETFQQQGKGKDWDKVVARYRLNTKARGETKLSGLDVLAALQSEVGWKGIYWAPDPDYQIPREELEGHHPTNPSKGIQSNEASYTEAIAKKNGTYYKNFGKKGYPGVAISQTVTDYAPEVPKAKGVAASTTTKNTAQLDKLKKLPFGVLAGHGGFHMTIITYGKVIEVSWTEPADSINLFSETDLENWTVGPRSGFHYLASGAIVAPAADVKAAFP